MKTLTTVKGVLSAKEVEDAIFEFLENYLENTVSREDYTIEILSDGSAEFNYTIIKEKA